jgi:hypothetical protein
MYRSLGLVALSLVLSGFRDNSPNPNNLNEKIDAISSQNIHGTIGGNYPSYLPQNGFFAIGDVLYWTASEDGLEYASRISVPLDGNFKERKVEPGFEWDFGFRLGIGALFERNDKWDLSLYTTYLRNEAERTSNASDPTTLLPIWGGGGFWQELIGEPFGTGAFLGDFASKAKATWVLNINLLDLEVGKNFFISKKISARPHLGIRGAWIRQDYKVKYDALFENPESFSLPFSPASTKMKADINFAGGGLRLGADATWHLYSCFGICGKFAASLLYGAVDTRQKYTGDSIDFNLFTGFLTPSTIHDSRSETRIQPAIETSLGLQWDADFRDKSGHLTIGLMNTLRRSVLIGDGSNDLSINSTQKEWGDLGLMGVTLNINVLF